ncbi:MAG TPA: cytochrome c [Gammaproteobacteria bacterium]|nr:cytochrome c [Gammaproteobacteria bacterium]
MKRIWIALLCMLAAGWAGAAQAQEGHSGEGHSSGGSAAVMDPAKIVNQGLPDKGVAPCKSCHGENGKSPIPMYPHLGGQYQDYLMQALKDYRSGARKNPTMNQQAGSLTDGQIEVLAGYFANQKTILNTLPR